MGFEGALRKPALNVCFVDYQAYPAIDSAAAGAVGGRELRGWLFAQGLARRADCRVTFVVQPGAPVRQRKVAGVEIIPLVNRRLQLEMAVEPWLRVSRSRPWIRIQKWNWRLLWQIPALVWLKARQLAPSADPRLPDTFFQQIGADAFCCLGVNAVSARVVASARARGAKSVLLLASDAELDERFGPDSDYVNPYGERGDVCWFVLQQADRIIAQTERQRELLRERFGRDADVIANPFDREAWDATLSRCNDEAGAFGLTRYALWVGRADDVHKRPLLCLELARLCPETDFLMVLNPRLREVEQRVRAECPANVRIIDQVPFGQMPSLFRNAAVFVSTSAAAYEGVPNTLLQAAASGVPIASLEVDAGFVAAEGCGEVAAGDVQRLAAYVRRVWENSNLGREEGERGQKYVRRHYSATEKTAELARILVEVCRGEPALSPARQGR